MCMKIGNGMSKLALVDKLISDEVLKTPRIIDAFKEIDRADFVEVQYKDEAYGDYPKMSPGFSMSIIIFFPSSVDS